MNLQSLTQRFSKALFVGLLTLGIATAAIAQNKFFAVQSANSKLPEAVEKTQNIRKISVVQLDEMRLRQYLQAAPLEFHNGGVTLPLEIPLPNGTTETFGMVESPVLSPEQAALHPDIKTYTGNGLKNKAYIVRLSLTSSGFNAIILNVENDAVYFEPYSTTDKSLYFSYFSRNAFIPKSQQLPASRCGVGSSRNANGSIDITGHQHQRENTPENNTGANLRTFRLAVAANGEFTETFTGADSTAKKAAAFADIATYVNRMNAVYRNELAISFTLVSGVNVVYFDKTKDIYNNADNSATLVQNQRNLDEIIGTDNYDIGHIIGRIGSSGEGLAQSPSACDENDKAKGTTNVGGDPFAQVFTDQAVFHEIGHQYGMSHSYNSSIPVCTTRSQDVSVEPGAGATIMSYGFTCNTDDYFSSTTTGPILIFHTANYTQTVNYLASISTCGTTTATGNTVPVVTEPANRTIPKSTPFALTGSATDANGDALTYAWEGTTTGEVTPPDATTLANTAKPPFSRSYEPAATNATRNFPLLSAILDGTNQAKGDKLPSVAFAMKHRLIVRDNRSGGGGTAFKEVTTTVDGGSGPFLETTNLSASYAGNSMQTITWSVNNTTAAPVSCSDVKISLSTDGGATFPTVLLASTPNDGSESVTLPDMATTTARIKVEAVGNIFFDISNSNFTITAPLPVELVDLTAKLVGKTTQLDWRTGSELNSMGFDIERSTDGGATFKKIGFVKAAGRAATYDFVDVAPREGVNYYRLKAIDVDQTFEYSKMVTVQLGNNKSTIRVYPTTTNGVVTIDHNGLEVDNVLVFNYVGQLVLSAQNTRSVNLSALPSGMYLVQVQSGNEQVAEKVFKQ